MLSHAHHLGIQPNLCRVVGVEFGFQTVVREQNQFTVQPTNPGTKPVIVKRKTRCGLWGTFSSVMSPSWPPHGHSSLWGTRETEVRVVESRTHVSWLPDGRVWTDHYLTAWCSGRWTAICAPCWEPHVVIWVVDPTPFWCWWTPFSPGRFPESVPPISTAHEPSGCPGHFIFKWKENSLGRITEVCRRHKLQHV